MIVVAIVSAKGGVGKTTVTANLGVGVAQRGLPVTMVDLDPQNALQWHLGGLHHTETEGVASQTERNSSLQKALYHSPYNVDFLPYGMVDEDQREYFEQILELDPLWLRKRLEELDLHENEFVFLDTPPGPSVYLEQAINASDFLLVVVLADAASYSTLPEMEELIATYGQREHYQLGSAYIINQGAQRQLAQDVIALFQERLNDRLVPYIITENLHVEEALAYEQPVILYEPENAASQAIQNIITWLLNGLGVTETAQS